ncbi:Z804B protein, partial [Psilopogon haemacephalus]|nr:Z804B protein [Psilopogon haemacephalus]
MACYLVISSRHLSNGHYRGIKGVFRGPLCKKGAGAPASATSALPPSIAPRTDYAEEEKAAAKALEDLKANFYCGLCDKQYHKHHEFDNHINSYDHAHKQRLKDLKQREFARNVASKSWKDEKKQEKALKRLHQLAELQKQSECISRSGPLLKAPRLVVEQPSAGGSLLCKGGRLPGSCQRSSRREGEGLPSSAPGKEQLVVSRRQRPAGRALPGHSSRESSSTAPRAGVSFSFWRRVPLKLESSASLFSETSEEGADCSGCGGQTAGQAPGGEVTASPDRGTPAVPAPLALPDSATRQRAAEPSGQEGDRSSDGAAEDKVGALPSFSKAKAQLSNLDFSGLGEAEQESKLQEPNQLPAALPSALSPCPLSPACPQPSASRQCGAHPAGQLPEPPQQAGPELASAGSSSAGEVQGERPAESCEGSAGQMEVPGREAGEGKPWALPFLPVVSKDGSTALQWPRELLLFTKSQPCISYGCNPLYFDFRLAAGPRAGGRQRAHEASCEGHPRAGNQASGSVAQERVARQAGGHSDKPKKMKGSLAPRRAEQEAVSGAGTGADGDGQKCTAESLNENPPKVPAQLEGSHSTHLPERPLQTTALGSPSQHLVRSWEGSRQSIRSESISFSALIARLRQPKAAGCHLLCSEEKPGNQEDCRALPDVASCSSDISDSSKDSGGSFLGSKCSSSSRCSETEECGSYRRCWRCPSPKPSSERLSCSSPSPVSSTRSDLSPSSNHRSRGHSLVCGRGQSEAPGRQGCRQRKHRAGVSPAGTGEAWLSPSRRHRGRKWAQRGTGQCGGCWRHRDRSKHSRSGHQHLGKGHSRSYRSTKSCSTRDSRSSRIPRGSRAGSFSKEAADGDSRTKEDTEGVSNTELGKEETAGDGNGESRALATCSSEALADNVCGRRKSLAAQQLPGAQCERSPGQVCASERLPNTCVRGLKGRCRGRCALQLAPPAGDSAALPVPEELLGVAAGDGRHRDGSLRRGSAEAPGLRSAALSPGTGCDHCLLQDTMPGGAGCQGPSRSGTATQEPALPLGSLAQPSLAGCEPGPSHSSAAFPSSSHSALAHSLEAEELPAVAMDCARAEGSWGPLCAHAVQHPGGTVGDPEGCRGSSCPPFLQQPVTFSPEEVDKYRLLQLRAQQHMQKQLLGKQLKAVPCPGPAAAAAALPAQQQVTLTAIPQALLQRVVLSAALHPQGSHLSLAHLHPLSQAHFAPASLCPLSPALLPTHPALLAGHPLQLVASSPLPVAPLLLPALPPAACLPALLTLQLPPAPSPQPLLHSQEPPQHSCSSQSQQLLSPKEVFSLYSYLT